MTEITIDRARYQVTPETAEHLRAFLRHHGYNPELSGGRGCSGECACEKAARVPDPNPHPETPRHKLEEVRRQLGGDL